MSEFAALDVVEDQAQEEQQPQQGSEAPAASGEDTADADPDVQEDAAV
jgi:hypothetical protein